MSPILFNYVTRSLPTVVYKSDPHQVLCLLICVYDAKLSLNNKFDPESPFSFGEYDVFQYVQKCD